MLRDAIMVLV